MKCYLCSTTTPLFRVNEKGVKGVWACKKHNTTPVDTLVSEIVEVIQGDNK